jgi:hypothetical protein
METIGLLLSARREAVSMTKDRLVLAGQSAKLDTKLKTGANDHAKDIVNQPDVLFSLLTTDGGRACAKAW